MTAVIYYQLDLTKVAWDENMNSLKIRKPQLRVGSIIDSL